MRVLHYLLFSLIHNKEITYILSFIVVVVVSIHMGGQEVPIGCLAGAVQRGAHPSKLHLHFLCHLRSSLVIFAYVP